MGIFDGTLLASDIDGTLLENGYINPRNIEKIEYFVREGGKFCLCTGRSIGAISAALEAAKATSYSIVANGCMIYDNTENKVIYQEFLPENDRNIADKIYSAMPNVGIEIHSSGEVFTLRQTAETDAHQQYEALPTVVLDFNKLLEYNWNKALYALENEGQYDEIRALNFDNEGSVFMTTTATIDGKKRNYFEQLPQGISKFVTLKRLCEIVGVKKGGLFAIGDYYNDLEMIKNSDIGAATADAPDEIKQYADFVAGSCEGGAVADFIDYLSETVKKPKG